MKRLLLFIIASLVAAGAYAETFDYGKIASHPRLLLAGGEEDAVRAALDSDGGLQTVHAGLLAASDRIIAKAPVTRMKEGKRLLAVSRTALTRIFYLSYSYRMTSDPRYASRAIEEMMAVCSFEDWNPSHFLDVGEMVMAVAIGYDWLYDCLDEEQRKTVADAIIEKGFRPSENKKWAWFYDRPNNWNQVCNSGLVFGALAIYEQCPDLAEKIIEKAVATNPVALECYAPDGGYPEGFGYWGYGTSFQVLMLCALESALGSDASLGAYPGFLESARFIQFATAPSGECFCFSDAERRVLCNMMMFWCADKLGDPSVLYLERKYLAALPENFSETADAWFAEARLLPSLPVFCSRFDSKNIAPPQGNFWQCGGETPLFIYRGGWDSSEDTYLGVKGGSPKTSHAHMDAGSFVYEYKGVRWAMDLGMQSYITLESRGVDLWNQSQDGERWDVFRLCNMAHSTLTLNGGRHLVESFAPIVRTWQSTSKKGAEVDMSSVFGDAVKSVIRSVTLDKKDRLTVRDAVRNGNDRTDLTWVMVTPADARITGKNTVELTKNGIRMLLKVDAPVPVEMQIWSNDPPHDYDFKNPGSCRVGFTASLEGGVAADFVVTLSQIK